MEPSEYERMSAVEDSMWWYRGLHKNLLALLDRFAPQARRVLDDGSGTGGFLARLAQHRQGLELFGIDIEPVAAAHAARKSGAGVMVGSVNNLPYDDASFEVVFSSDILCHAQVDPGMALAEAYRVLKPQGLLFLQLPAYEWMKSYHDIAVHNARRFTRSGAVAIAETAGFNLVFATYWNTFLFPLMALQRLVVVRKDENSDVGEFPALLSRIFSFALDAERSIFGRGIPLPFGGSILIVAKKPA